MNIIEKAFFFTLGKTGAELDGFQEEGGVRTHENDISAEEKISCESSWISGKNEHEGRT